MYLGERGRKRSWEVRRYHFALVETSGWSFIVSYIHHSYRRKAGMSL